MAAERIVHTAAPLQQVLDDLEAGGTRTDDQDAAWRQLADTTPDSHPQVVQALTHWRQDSDLVSTRDAEPLSRLPEAEQQQWRDLWNQVEQLRQLCASNPPAAGGGVTTDPLPAER